VAATLSDGTRVTYVTDAFGRRIGKKVNGLLIGGFLYGGPRILAQTDAKNNIVSEFVYGSRVTTPDYMIFRGETYRIFSDQLGSPRLVVNAATGEIAERVDYDEFGNVVADSEPGFQPFGFAGGLYDRDTKLIRFGARDYSPALGRWTTRDPHLFAGGDPNLFAYAANSPVTYVDPSGFLTVSVGLSAGIGGGRGGIGGEYGLIMDSFFNLASYASYSGNLAPGSIVGIPAPYFGNITISVLGSTAGNTTTNGDFGGPFLNNVLSIFGQGINVFFDPSNTQNWGVALTLGAPSPGVSGSVGFSSTQITPLQNPVLSCFEGLSNAMMFVANPPVFGF